MSIKQIKIGYKIGGSFEDYSVNIRYKGIFKVCHQLFLTS